MAFINSASAEITPAYSEISPTLVEFPNYLNKCLDKVIERYTKETEYLFDEETLNPTVTKKDLLNLSRATAIALGEFKDTIVKNMK